MQGSRCRATASTSMNARSSRSHAIFTITLEQRRSPASPAAASDGGRGSGGGDESGDEEDQELVEDYLCAKMHLVDLAGGCGALGGADLGSACTACAVTCWFWDGQHSRGQ